jgi:hypothetical protein
MTTIQQIQELAGVPQDGVWGAQTDAAVTGGLQRDPDFVKKLQGLCGVLPDGNWGSVSSAALKCVIFGISINGVNTCKATSFADPADVAAFRKCKAEGGTDEHCFAFGDNAIGAWGNDTSAGSGPQVALPPEVLIALYVSLTHAKGKNIVVTNLANGKSVQAVVEDLMPHLGHEVSGAGIDCNYDTVAELGEEAPMSITVTWRAI